MLIGVGRMQGHDLMQDKQIFLFTTSLFCIPDLSVNEMLQVKDKWSSITYIDIMLHFSLCSVGLFAVVYYRI